MTPYILWLRLHNIMSKALQAGEGGLSQETRLTEQEFLLVQDAIGICLEDVWVERYM